MFKSLSKTYSVDHEEMIDGWKVYGREYLSNSAMKWERSDVYVADGDRSRVSMRLCTSS